MPTRSIRPLLVAIAATGLFAPHAIAAGPAAPDPAAYLQAFNDTCRRGFPDFDVIADNALAHGWRESSMRRLDGMADIFSARMSRSFNKDGLMLFLTYPSGGNIAEVCQITGTGLTKATGAQVAAIVSPSLNAGQPVMKQDSDRDAAVWPVAPKTEVEAGVSIYRRKVRTISISVRHFK